MQVKLKNNGDALRVLYDMNTTERVIRPGQEVTVEVSQTNARKYEEAERKGDSLSITLVDKYDDEVDKAEKAVRLPSPDDDKPQRQPAQPRLDHSFTARESMGGDQPRSRREAEDGPIDQDAERREIERTQGGDDETKGDGAATGKVTERVRIKPDRIAATARNANKEKPAPAKPKGKPKTAADVLARLDDLEPGQIIEYANAVLPKGALPQKPKLAQVSAALRAQAQADAKAAKGK